MKGGAVYLRNPAISVTEIDADTFLVEPEEGEVFYLDQVSSGLWRYLAVPRNRSDIVDTFAAAFPGTAIETIEADILAALDELIRRELVNTVSS